MGAQRARCRREGFALATVFWWVFAVSTVLLIVFGLTLQKSRWEAKIQEGMDHFYLAESVMAMEVNRLKAKAWSQRWYRDAAQTGDPTKPVPAGAILGQTIIGTFPRVAAGSTPRIVAEYEGFVQDVVDFWPGTSGTRLDKHTDIFLKVTYPVHYPRVAADPPGESRYFFQRVVFRQPSTERPTNVHVRRFTDIPQFDPKSTSSRAAVLCQVNEAEIQRERNRPLGNVLEREILASLAQGTSFSRIARSVEGPRRPPSSWSLFATPAMACENEDERYRERSRPKNQVIEREVRRQQGSGSGQSLSDVWHSLEASWGAVNTQVTLEEQQLASLGRGQIALATPGRIGDAPEQFDAALKLAQQQDAANREYTLPKTLLALARSEWMFARTLPRRGARAGERITLIDSAAERLRTVIDRYPWIGSDPSDAAITGCVRSSRGGPTPDRLEAPHSFVPLAFMLVDREDPGGADGPARYNQAIKDGVAILENLRGCYPYFHLWGEDAVTGFPHDGESTKADEVVWYEEQLLPAPLTVIGGSENPKGIAQRFSEPTGSIMRWTPQPAPGGLWIQVGALETTRCGAATAVLPAIPGTQPGDTLLMVGGGGGGISLTSTQISITNPTLTDAPAAIYDPLTNQVRSPSGAWASLYGPMAHRRQYHACLTLRDGRVLITGGTPDYRSCEIFDPATETFREVAAMTQNHTSHRMEMLRSGMVLVVGGGGGSEVYDPAANRWTRVRYEPRNNFDLVSVPLDDGSVLVAGGGLNRGTSNPGADAADLYLPEPENIFFPGTPPLSPAAGSPWPDAPVMGRRVAGKPAWFGAGRVSPNAVWAVKLRDGRVLIGGGRSDRYLDGYSDATYAGTLPSVRSTELFDPATRQFSSAGDTAGGWNEGRQATLLADGRALVAGGACCRILSPDVDVFDPVSGSWQKMPPLPFPMGNFTMSRPGAE